MSVQDLKLLIAWAGPHAGIPPSSALPSILSLLESAPACYISVFLSLQAFLNAALGRIFQTHAPANKQSFAQRFTAGAGGREGRESNNVTSLNEDVRIVCSHLMGVLQRNSVHWAPIIAKWTIDVLQAAESIIPRSMSANIDTLPSLESLLAQRLKHPVLKHLSSLLSSTWIFLDVSIRNNLLNELLVGAGGEKEREKEKEKEKENGKAKGSVGGTEGELEWILALVGALDPDCAIRASLLHLCNLYSALDTNQKAVQQLAGSRAGKLTEFLSFRFPIHASSSLLLLLNNQLLPSPSSSSSSTSSTSLLADMEIKIGFLATLGTAFPKLFEASFGAVLECLEASAATGALPSQLKYASTGAHLEVFITECMRFTSSSPFLPRIITLLHSISKNNPITSNNPNHHDNGVDGMEVDSSSSLKSVAASLLSRIFTTVRREEAREVSGSVTSQQVMWSISGQWQVLWDLGDLAQSLVLISLLGLHRVGRMTSSRNVDAVAGAVLAHVIAKTHPDYDSSKLGYDPFLSLTAVINAFASQEGFLGSALDFVMSQVAPNPAQSSVVLSRLADFVLLSSLSPSYFSLSYNVAMHWEKILSFVSHPHLPLRLAALRLLQSFLPFIFPLLPPHSPVSLLSFSSPSSQQDQQKVTEKMIENSTSVFHIKSTLKIKMDVIAMPTITRTLTKIFLNELKTEKLDFEYIESLISTISVATSLSPIIFGLVVTLILDYTFSDNATSVIREALSTPLLPMNTLPPPPFNSNIDKEGRSLLEMNYTRHWRAQLHNRLGSGVFIPKRPRLDSSSSKTDYNFPLSVTSIPVRDGNILNDLIIPSSDSSSHPIDPDIDFLALRRGVIVGLLGRCVVNQPSSYYSILTDQYLVHLATQAPVPTYLEYAEVLPRISPFDRDIFLKKAFKLNPILLDFLELIAEEPLELIKLIEIIKGTLANTISHWHADPNTSTSKNTYFNFTVRFINILGKAQWVPHPLSCCGEIVGVMTPSELSMLLITMWNFIRDFPPSPDSYVSNNNNNGPDAPNTNNNGKKKRVFTANTRLGVFIKPMRTIVHAHIVELGALYRAYFDPNNNQ